MLMIMFIICSDFGFIQFVFLQNKAQQVDNLVHLPKNDTQLV